MVRPTARTLCRVDGMCLVRLGQLGPWRTPCLLTDKRAMAVALAVVGITAAACGSSSSGGSSTSPSTTPTTSAAPINISTNSFTRDFSAMAALKPLAAEGNGSVGVILPDTDTSARYAEFDAPYLTQAFKAAGLTSSQIIVKNAQAATTPSSPTPRPRSPTAPPCC